MDDTNQIVLMLDSVITTKKVDGSTVSTQEEIDAKFKELEEKKHRQNSTDNSAWLDLIQHAMKGEIFIGTDDLPNWDKLLAEEDSHDRSMALE